MKFGFRTGGFRDWKIEAILKKLASIGFDGVELCLESADMRPENFTQTQANDLKKLISKLGLEIASISYHADTETPAQRRANAFKSVEIAEWLGIDVLIINAERTREGEKEQQWQELVESLVALTELAEKKGVNLAFEPEPLTIIDDIDDMLRLVDDVGSKNLRVNLDIGHAYITDPDLPESIRQFGDMIVHAHLEDIKDKIHNHLELGEGDIDFAAMHQAFADIRYDGYYVVDLFRLGDDPAGVATRSLAALRERF